jgi:hypothetical protein
LSKGLSVSLVSIFLTFASQCSSVFSASVATFLADIAWIFPVKYAARILLINEMRGKTFDCSQADIASGVCTAATGQQVLDLFGFHDSTGKLVGILIATTVAYRVAAWAILALRYSFLLGCCPPLMLRVLQNEVHLVTVRLPRLSVAVTYVVVAGDYTHSLWFILLRYRAP